MTRYVLRRLVGMIPMFVGIAAVSFLVLHLAPGAPTDAAPVAINAKIDPHVYEELRKLYGLDRPLHEQFLDWLGRVIRLDFGLSMSVDRRPVLDKILEALPVTVGFNLASLVLVLLLAIPLGVYSAVRTGSLVDRVLTVVVFLGFATPSFWLALLLMMLLGVQLGWLPVSWASMPHWADVPFGVYVGELLRHGAIPIFCLSFGALAVFSRYMRAAMREALAQEYVLSARARGRGHWSAVWRHAFPNALIPIVTLLGLTLPSLVGGSVILESIFAIPGMGRLFVEAVYVRDYALIMGNLTLIALLTLVGNLLADVGYALVDPRVRHQTEQGV